MVALKKHDAEHPLHSESQERKNNKLNKMKKNILSALGNFDAKKIIPVAEINKVKGGLATSTPDTCSGNCQEDDCESDPGPIIPIKSGGGAL